MSVNSSAEEHVGKGGAEEKDVLPKPLLDLPKDTLISIFQALDLESLVTVARTSKALNQVALSDLVWVERCRKWEKVIALTVWRTRMDSGKALFKLLRLFNRLVGTWTHVHIPSNPRGSLIYITWGVDGLEGWKVHQMIQDGGQVTFNKFFDIYGRQDGSCELVSAKEDPTTGELRREASDVICPPQQSYDELYIQGIEPEAESEALGILYKRLKVESPTPGRNLAGLWTGLYYMHGWEILNVTYLDESLEDCSLVGTKVTGDPNVPSGEISFVATLREPEELGDSETPSQVYEPHTQVREPQWTRISATRRFAQERHDEVSVFVKSFIYSRYPGEGRIADEIFRNPNWVPGALLVGSNKVIRFVWQLYGDIDYRPLDLEASFRKKDVVQNTPMQEQSSLMQHVRRR